MKPKVYIETSIPSFYFETRSEEEMLAIQSWTIKWWSNEASNYQLFTSAAVLEELDNGRNPHRDKALSLMSEIPLLEITPSIIGIASEYISKFVMPNNPQGDALHLAVASYHSCQFLLTWNCKHLANANKTEHIRHVNSLLGIGVPILTTPLELIQSS